MIERPTPETDKRAWSDHSEGILYEVVQASFARKLELERDKAREDATNYYAKIGELEHERDEAREKYETLAVENMLEVHRLCKERDEAIADRDIARLEVEEISQELADARKQIEGLNNFANERYDEIQEVRKERDDAREALEEEKKFHHRTHSELVQTQCKVLDLTQAIIATLEENRHLADGDDCTLAKLKSVVPEWK